MSSANIFDDDPLAAWQFWKAVQEKSASAPPNAAHTSLADWESSLGDDQRFTVITQNVDRLHQKAGSKNVIELHGTIMTVRCSDPSCSQSADYEQVHLPEIPRCTKCSAVLRPDIVLFDEMLPAEAEWKSKRALRDCDLFIAVGTSGTVSPASGFVNSAKYAEAKTVLVNLEPMKPANPAFDYEFIGPAEEVLPKLLSR